MDITSVSSAIATPATGNVSKTKAAQSNGNVTATDVYTSKIAEIAAKYDPSRIPMNKIPDLAKELYKNGLISATDSMVMSAQPGLEARLEKDGQTLGLVKDAGGNVDLLTHWKNLAKQQKTTETTKTANTLEALSSQSKTDNNSAVNSAVDLQGAVSAYESGNGNSTMDSQRVVDVLEAIVKKKN